MNRVDLDVVEKRMNRADSEEPREPPTRDEVAAMIAELRAHREVMVVFRELVEKVEKEAEEVEFCVYHHEVEVARAKLEELEKWKT